MIKIVTTKKWKQMLADLEEVRSANVGLHELMKGHYNKYSYDLGQKDDAIKKLEVKVKDLEKKLKKVEHERNELRKKIQKEKDKAKS